MPVDSDAYYSLAVAETAAVVLRREQYSETISENPASQDAEKRPGDGSPGASAAANANSESIKQNPAATMHENPPKNPPRADWTTGDSRGSGRTGGLKDRKKETVINLDAAKARREAEEAAKKVADLEQTLAEAERRAAAAGPQQWCEAPGDFAKAAVATDANKAIDAMEALQDALRGTLEWRAYQDELFENFARTANKIKEERDAEKRTELVADPKEQRIVRIKNA